MSSYALCRGRVALGCRNSGRRPICRNRRDGHTPISRERFGFFFFVPLQKTLRPTDWCSRYNVGRMTRTVRVVDEQKIPVSRANSFRYHGYWPSKLLEYQTRLNAKTDFRAFSYAMFVCTYRIHTSIHRVKFYNGFCYWNFATKNNSWFWIFLHNDWKIN